MADITAIVLTYNEELHIERCLQSLNKVCRKIILVDSSSTDRTSEIGKAYGADIYEQPFVNYAHLFQWAIDNCRIETAWVMRFDADEVLTPELIEEIEAVLPDLGREIVGVNLRRRHYFLGEWVRYGGRYPLILLRIWRRGHARIEQRWTDEHMMIEGGDVFTFKKDFSDHNLNDTSWWTAKHIKYANREAVATLIRKYGLFPESQSVRQGGGSLQASIRRILKEGLYARMPFLMGPLLYFLFRYIFQLGFLDSKGGRSYHFLQGLWYRAFVDVRVLELERLMEGCLNNEARIDLLEVETKLRIREFANSVGF